MHTRAKVIVIKNNQILLLFRNKFGDVYFTLPGGGAKKIDKSIEDTAIREVFEETSIKIKIVKQIEKVFDKDGNQTHYLYTGEYISGTPKLGEFDEKERMNKFENNLYVPMWVNLDCIKNIKIHSNFFENIVIKHLEEII